jgi:serine/threonine protein kinase
LQTWLDLPEHPHLVACRFFRTVGTELAIFAEYVEGGSLEHWIKERRLTQLEQILDVAIQFAWGLHAAHELGLVHQDVSTRLFGEGAQSRWVGPGRSRDVIVPAQWLTPGAGGCGSGGL